MKESKVGKTSVFTLIWKVKKLSASEKWNWMHIKHPNFIENVTKEYILP